MDKNEYLIKLHAKNIAENLICKKLNYFDSIKLSSVMLENLDDFPINTILNFFIATKNALDIMKLPITKTAYPQGDSFQFVYAPHNIANWVKSMRTIYNHVNQGLEISKAFDLVTEKWDKMAKQDFKHWMSFYQQDGHKAYKKASQNEKTANYLEVGSGAFLPLDKNDLRGSIPGIPSRFPDMNSLNNVVKEDVAFKEEQERTRKKLEQDEIQRQIKALIGRLNSAERIATTKGIDKALGPVYETWLKALHDLKREIQIAPLRNVRSSLLTDLIVRKGNQLASSGYDKPAQLMYKLAQVAPPPLEPTPETKEEKPANPGKEPEKLPEVPPMEMPTELPQTGDMPSFDGPGANDDKWVDEFLKGLSGLIDENDVQEVNDLKDELCVESADDLFVEDDLVVVAQEAVPETAPAPEALPTDMQKPGNSEGNSEIDKALANVTVQDVIVRLESLANIFKNREISRQLSLVDIMMDKLGIASYFPNLAEATTKSLDANQYVLTRVEDILGKLRGSVDAAIPIDLNKSSPIPSNATGVKNNLEQAEQKDDARRKAREDARDQAEDAQIAGQQVSPAQELAQPAQIQSPAPAVRV
jgi:hypothetical protein